MIALSSTAIAGSSVLDLDRASSSPLIAGAGAGAGSRFARLKYLELVLVLGRCGLCARCPGFSSARRSSNRSGAYCSLAVEETVARRSNGSARVQERRDSRLTLEERRDVHQILQIMDRDSRLERLEEWKGRLTQRVVGMVLHSVRDGESAMVFFGWIGTRQEFKLTVDAHHCFYSALVRTGRWDEAYRHFRQSWPKELIPNATIYGLLIQGLCNFGKLKLASTLYEEMVDRGTRPAVLTCKFLLNALCKSGDFETAFRYFERMSRLPDPAVWTVLIDGLCKGRRVEEAYRYFKEMKQVASPNNWTYTLIIQGLVKAGKAAQAEQVLQEMPAPTLSAYTLVLGGHCKTGDMEKAYELLDKMRIQGFHSDNVTYNTLIQGHCKMKDIDRAYELLEEMKSKDATPDKFTFAILIAGLCRANRLSDAQHLLDELRSRNDPASSVVTHNTLIDGFCKASRINDALRLFQDMVTAGPPPDVVTYSTIILGLCNARRASEAHSCLQEMIRKNVFPKAPTYNCVISGLCRAGKADVASAVFDTMIANKCEPTTVVYNSLISGLCKTGRICEANLRVNEMTGRGCLPDKVTYATLIVGLCRSNRANQAYDLFVESLGRGIEVDETSSNTLISCLRECEQTQRVLQAILATGETPTPFIYSTVIEHLSEKKNNAIEARHLLGDMISAGHKPSSRTLDALIAALCRQSRPEEAMALLQEVVELGSDPTIPTYGRVMQGLIKARKPGKAYETLQLAIRNTGCFPDESWYENLIAANAKLEQMDEACRLLREMTQEWGLQSLVAYNTVLKGLLEMGDVRSVYEVLKEMEASECVVNEGTFNILIEGFCRMGQINRALQVLSEMKKVITPSTEIIRFLVDALKKAGRHRESNKLFKHPT